METPHHAQEAHASHAAPAAATMGPAAIGTIPPYPAIRRLLAWHRGIPLVGAAFALVLGAIAGWRLMWPELYFVGGAAALAAHFLLRVALEVVQLVAETLMPQ